MKKLISVISLLLTVITVLSCVGCASESTKSEDTKSDDTEPSATVAETEEETVVPKIYYDGGMDVTFLTQDIGEWATVEIYAENDSSEPIEAAVFMRNAAIYDEYGIRIKEYRSDYPATVLDNVIQSGSQDYYGVTSPLSVLIPTTTKGYLLNLAEDVPYLNLKNPWWDGGFTDGLSIDGNVFFATGDLLTTDNDATFIVLFNKTILENKHILENTGTSDKTIYNLVTDYEWTYEKMSQMSSMATLIDGDSSTYERAYNGQIGFAMTSNVPYGLLYSGGIVICKKDSDDMPESTIDTERLDKVVTAAHALYGDTECAFNIEAGTGGVVENGKECFGGGHALFMGECLQCVIRLRGYDVNFGVIPYPMLDTAQKAYYSFMHMSGSVVAVPKSLDEANAEIAGITLELMASKSVDTLTKAYYDITLIGKGTRDAESEPMIELILESRVFDPAYAYGWGKMAEYLAKTIITGESATRVVATYGKKLNADIRKTMKNFN